MELKPSAELEKSIRIINHNMNYTRIPYWLSFGALWGLVRNNGTVPDGDFDICTYYGADWKKIRKVFESRGFTMSKALINDADPENILYMGFNHPEYAHVCISFWYPAHGMRWYCHDENKDVPMGQTGVPKSGYYMKGVPAEIVNDESMFKMVEWPGIDGLDKIRVPIMAGTMLDNLYIGWAYKKQHYVPGSSHLVDVDKLRSYYAGGAQARYAVHLDTFGQMADKPYIDRELAKSEAAWRLRLKEIVKKQ